MIVIAASDVTIVVEHNVIANDVNGLFIAEPHAGRTNTGHSDFRSVAAGGEDRSLWRSLGRARVTRAPTDKLRDVPPGADVDMEGRGEILRIEDKPTPWHSRSYHRRDSKLITDEVFQSLPEPYRVARYGYSPNKVVPHLR